MTEGYVKLFSSLVTSSIWVQSDSTRIVWITMLALSNADGVVLASVPGLARVAGVSLESCQEAIALLEAPDEHSRTPDMEGRRIVQVDGGWQLVNHKKYRERMATERKREMDRQRKRRQRERDVTRDSRDMSRLSRQEEEEEEEDADAVDVSTKKKGNPNMAEVMERAQVIGLSQDQAEAFFDYYESNGWRVGKNKMKSWHSAMSGWKRRHEQWAPASKKPEAREQQEKFEIRDL